MSEHAVELVQKLRSLTEHREPWTHFTADDFLPADILADLLDFLPRSRIGPRFGEQRQRTQKVPEPALKLLTDHVVIQAIRQQFGFTGGKVLAEVAWFGSQGYPAHNDRHDKLWNGQVYLQGDSKGTELFDDQERLAKVVEWQPNRLTVWTPPGGGKKHAAPASQGRFLLLWWILAEKRS